LAKHETLLEAVAGQLDQETLRIRGARVHNLKNISVEIPHNAITVVSGVSGSGKSSLAFDTVYAEGQRRYVESLSAYARQFWSAWKNRMWTKFPELRPQLRFARKIPRAIRAPRSRPPRKSTIICDCFCALRANFLHQVWRRSLQGHPGRDRGKSFVCGKRTKILCLVPTKNCCAATSSETT
jgi:excinuclease UvrABC ATPase subunit